MTASRTSSKSSGKSTKRTPKSPAPKGSVVTQKGEVWTPGGFLRCDGPVSSQREVFHLLSRIARFDLNEWLFRQEDGSTGLDWRVLSEPCVKRAIVKKDGTILVDLYPKLPAVKLLSEMKGWFKRKEGGTGSGSGNKQRLIQIELVGSDGNIKVLEDGNTTGIQITSGGGGSRSVSGDVVDVPAKSLPESGGGDSES